MSSKVLNLDRQLRWLGPKDKRGYAWAEQDGRIFGWSESNVRYEEAWWLDHGGNPTNANGLATRVAQQRPFYPEWLYHMKVHYQFPIFWTACNMSKRSEHMLPGSLITITKDKSKVTCGNCRRTQGFFSRDDVPGDPIVQKVTR